MDNRRFKIGDKVLITLYDPNKTYRFGFVSSMQIYCGRVMTIRDIFNEDLPADRVDYRLAEDKSNFSWSISMFDLFTVDNDFIDLNLFL